MTIHTTTKRVPEHLVGTRAGLFHVLRGTSILPQDDPMATADLPNAFVTEQSNTKSDAMTTSPVFQKSERDRMNAFLSKDEFHFHY